MLHVLYTFAQTTSQTAAADGSPVVDIIYFLFLLIVIVGMWQMFTKAGRPGWAAIVPFYNTYTIIKIAGKPGWWLIPYLIPIVNIYFSIVVGMEIGRRFGRSQLFGILVCGLFGGLGYAIIGYSDSEYTPAPTE